MRYHRLLISFFLAISTSYCFSGISKEAFERIVSEIQQIYLPIYQKHDASLEILTYWDKNDLIAKATKQHPQWRIIIFGGIARQPRLNEDGFAALICHEIGHHLGGYPFKKESGVEWASTEGQADYYTSQICLKHLWTNDIEKNQILAVGIEEQVKTRCDLYYTQSNNRNLCYRIMLAGKNFVDLGADLLRSPISDLTKKAPESASSTLSEHPSTQCRLDTIVSGNLCIKNIDREEIPGLNALSEVIAERLSNHYNCTIHHSNIEQVRPECWFTSQATIFADVEHAVIKEVSGNHDIIKNPGETYSINIPILNQTDEILTSPQINFSEHGSLSYPEINIDQTKFSNQEINFTIPHNIPCGKWQLPFVISNEDRVMAHSTVSMDIGGYLALDQYFQSIRLDIPDKQDSGILVEFNSNISSTTDKASIKIDLIHKFGADIRIILIAPSGNKYTVFNQDHTFKNEIKKEFEVLFTSPEKSQGLWQLQISDLQTNDVGYLLGWGINLQRYICHNE